LILAMTFMAACSHASQTPLLTDAEAFLPAEPDSADARLKQDLRAALLSLHPIRL